MTTGQWNGPLTIRVSGPDLERFALPVGTLVTLAPDVVRVGPVPLRLDTALCWRRVGGRDAPGVQTQALRAGLQALLHRSARAANTSIPAHSVVCAGHSAVPPANDWRSHGIVACQAMMRGLAAGDVAIIDRAVYQLLGLGPGLTPAGDDILSGLVAGLTILFDRCPIKSRRLPAVAALCTALERFAAARTTTLSRTILLSATRGVAYEPLLDVLCTLGSGRELRGVETLLATGHSSGSDMLTGVCMAATALLGWEEESGTALVGPA